MSDNARRSTGEHEACRFGRGRGESESNQRFHDLRHTFASRLLQNGESVVSVKDQFGRHSIKVTVDVYGYLAPGAAYREQTLPPVPGSLGATGPGACRSYMRSHPSRLPGRRRISSTDTLRHSPGFNPSIVHGPIAK